MIDAKEAYVELNELDEFVKLGKRIENLLMNVDTKSVIDKLNRRYRDSDTNIIDILWCTDTSDAEYVTAYPNNDNMINDFFILIRLNEDGTMDRVELWDVSEDCAYLFSEKVAEKFVDGVMQDPAFKKPDAKWMASLDPEWCNLWDEWKQGQPEPELPEGLKDWDQKYHS